MPDIFMPSQAPIVRAKTPFLTGPVKFIGVALLIAFGWFTFHTWHPWRPSLASEVRAAHTTLIAIWERVVAMSQAMNDNKPAAEQIVDKRTLVWSRAAGMNTRVSERLAFTGPIATEDFDYFVEPDGGVVAVSNGANPDLPEDFETGRSQMGGFYQTPIVGGAGGGLSAWLTRKVDKASGRDKFKSESHVQSAKAYLTELYGYEGDFFDDNKRYPVTDRTEVWSRARGLNPELSKQLRLDGRFTGDACFDYAMGPGWCVTATANDSDATLAELRVTWQRKSGPGSTLVDITPGEHLVDPAAEMIRKAQEREARGR